jgi:hypothetical protein
MRRRGILHKISGYGGKMGKQARYSGYVVGKVSRDGKLVWKVRIMDEISSYNGQKFIVRSTHDGIALCSGLDVTFSIGTVGNINRRKMVAIDVQAENLSEAQDKA